jgi:predicted RNA-binding Zn-ribbon protein involved in translation (DUF1610 family)
MKKTGFTIAKCMGCGKTNDRKTDFVCPECLEAIETHRINKEYYEKCSKENGFDLVEANIQYLFSYPSYSTFRTNQFNHSLKPIGLTLCEISKFVSLSKGQQIAWGYMRHLENEKSFAPYVNTHNNVRVFDRPRATNEETILIPKQLMNLLSRLDKEIKSAIEKTEEGAVLYGKNALLMLNNGHITLDEFNKK